MASRDNILKDTDSNYSNLNQYLCGSYKKQRKKCD